MIIVLYAEMNKGDKENIYHEAKPVNVPEDILKRRDTRPNAISAQKRICWPINLYCRTLEEGT
jgi:hypothetical protein